MKTQFVFAAALSLLTACTGVSTSVGELNYAVMNENLTAVRAGIQNGANVNGINNDKKTRPLHAAASKGNITIVRELVEAGAEVDPPDCSGRSPLMFAVKADSVAVSRYLIDQGARVNRTAGDSTRTCDNGSPDETPLVIAAATNNPEMVRLLLSKGATAGGKRAFAISLLDPSREPVAKQLRAAGYTADESTARMVAELSSKSTTTVAAEAQTAAVTPEKEGDGLDSWAMDAAAAGAVLGLLGAF